LPFEIKDVASAFAAAARIVDLAKSGAETVAEELNDEEIRKAKEAWGQQGSKLTAGGSKAIKELEKGQKSRQTRMVHDTLDTILLDLAVKYREKIVSAETTFEEKQAGIRKIDAIMDARGRLARNAAPLLTMEALMVSLRAGFYDQVSRSIRGRAWNNLPPADLKVVRSNPLRWCRISPCV
jgi:DNA polymerase-3 subunit delta'